MGAVTGTGPVLGQRQVADKSNEVPQFKRYWHPSGCSVFGAGRAGIGV